MAEQSGRPRGDDLVVPNERNDADQRHINELADLGQRTNPCLQQIGEERDRRSQPDTQASARIKSGIASVWSAATVDRGDRLRRNAVIVAAPAAPA